MDYDKAAVPGGLRKWETTVSHFPYLSLRYSRTYTVHSSALWRYVFIYFSYAEHHAPGVRAMILDAREPFDPDCREPLIADSCGFTSLGRRSLTR